MRALRPSLKSEASSHASTAKLPRSNSCATAGSARSDRLHQRRAGEALSLNRYLGLASMRMVRCPDSSHSNRKASTRKAVLFAIVQGDASPQEELLSLRPKHLFYVLQCRAAIFSKEA